ncbi:DUF4342 domain-containing protein [Cryobacterium sp. 1639]|uniref:DUF4342 domain-containing protein n=1 Tax=Cryobacterium inferilacus TaxID=2866629 RepID=UPI001C731FD2|nr:DUF4342 domain-containing protein [Cryobacterium sp. 1639]MBX0300401.1 DUF4342 domain-containing protein [Cryobacterium sp. 1639]
MTENNRYEEFKISGDTLLTKVRELLHEGNVRRVFIKNDEGATLLEIPLTAGLAVTVITAAFSPVLVAVGAIAALLTQVTVGVERRDPGDDDSSGTDGVASDTD